jgi:hypothetical protein
MGRNGIQDCWRNIDGELIGQFSHTYLLSCEASMGPFENSVKFPQ